MRLFRLAYLCGKTGEADTQLVNPQGRFIVVGDHCPGFGGGYLGNLACGIVLESGHRAEHGGDRHHDEDAGLGQDRDLLDGQHQHEAENRHRQGGQMRQGKISQHFPDILEEEIAAPFGDAEQQIQLGKADDEGRRIHEPENHRMGDKVDRAAEFDCSENQLDDPHHECQQQGQTDILLGCGYGQRRDGGRGHERDNGHGPGGQQP